MKERRDGEFCLPKKRSSNVHISIRLSVINVFVHERRFKFFDMTINAFVLKKNAPSCLIKKTWVLIPGYYIEKSQNSHRLR